MKLSYNIVICDTSCLILLSKIDELELLNQLFDKVYTTHEIAREFRKKLPEKIIIQSPQNQHYQEFLQIETDKGEASAMALSYEIPDSILVLDDLKARKLADQLNLKYTGTFGIILKAKKSGIIKEVKPLIEKIRKTNFRFTEELFRIVLNEAGE
jgi:predicted nucleic acid-binding protein